MKTSANGRKLIEQFEGLSLKTYDDGTGVLTIGYGHTSAAGAPKVRAGQTITRDQADSILASDLAKVEAQISNLVKVSITQNQFDALVSFQFNTGALSRSTLLKKLNVKDYKSAADEFLKWNMAGGKVLQGLIKRRQAERELFNKKDTVSGVPTATAVVVAGGTAAAAHTWPHISFWLIAGVAVAVVVVYEVIKHYFGKKQ